MVKILMLAFWVVTLYGLVGRYESFGETYCLYLQPEDGNDIFPRNVNYLQDRHGLHGACPENSLSSQNRLAAQIIATLFIEFKG
jgi:hypothetical protein